MNVLIWLVICAATSIFCLMSLELYPYIISMDNNVCSGCGRKETCIAQKRLFKDSNFVSEFMLLTYISLRKKCEYISSTLIHKVITCIIVNTLLVSILYWSGGIVNITSVVYSVSASMLFALSIVDWNTQYIPVEYTGIILICGLIRLFADISNWWQYVIGLIAVSGFLYIVDVIATPVLRKKYGDDDISHVMGDGDIKLMAATGLLLGWKLNILALGIGCIAGSVIHIILMRIKKGERQFAFGPYLSLGVFITMICGEQLVSWYLNMMRL